MVLSRSSRYNTEFIILIIMFQIIRLYSAEFKARLRLDVEGNGFHRKFVYTVQFTNFTQENCHVALYLEIPSAVYVNIDELADLQRLRKNTVCSDGETDVEVFMEKAMSQNVTICANLNGVACTVEFPIHQRYRYAKDGGGYTKVIFDKPKLLLGCKERIKEYRVSKIKLCSACADKAQKWREIIYAMDREDYAWMIPVGNTSHRSYVVFVTVLTTIIGTLLVLIRIKKSVLIQNSKKD